MAPKNRKQKEEELSEEVSEQSEEVSQENSEEDSDIDSEQEGGEDEEEENPKRYFKGVDPKTGELTGRYSGLTPKQGASKYYTKITQKYRKNGKKPPKHTKVYIRESTRQRKKKIYGYTCESVTLDEPQTVTITNKETGE